MSFDVLDAIRQRRSVRTYDDSRPLTVEQRNQIIDYARALDNPFGVESIKISMANKDLSPGEKLGTYGVIKGANTFIGLIVKNNYRSYMAGAYLFEELILYITSLGLGTVWLGGTFNKAGFAQAMKVPVDMMLVAVSPVGYAARPRLTEKLMRKFSKGDQRRPWEDMFFKGAELTPMSNSGAGVYTEPLEMVRLAPSAVNAQPWRVVRDNKKWHFYVEYKSNASEQDKIYRHLDIGIALCHFELAANSIGLKGRYVDHPLPVINVPADWHYISTWIDEKDLK